MFKLLTRDEFREQCLLRDGQACVVCGGKEGIHVHHILERKLWPDGGYYLENGASVCEVHHLAAEKTEISCEDLRRLCGISKWPIPEHLYPDETYDKWGNPILPNGERLKGELFEDASVQKIIASSLSLFTDKVKYPRSYHLPWSPGVTKDDRIMSDLSLLQSSPIVITAKMDGENTSMYSDYIHARSKDYRPHPSRDWIRALHGRIAHDIPKGWRICGENLYAKHSIKYENLTDYFQVFSIWNEKNECLSWEETKEWASLLGLTVVPVLYEGPFNGKALQGYNNNTLNGDPLEGYVVRIAGRFHYKEFRRAVGKWVRKNFVQTDRHWTRGPVIVNGLR